MEHRRLHLLFGIIALFAFGVILWYFFFAAPKEAPTLSTTSNPLEVTSLPARIGFVLNSVFNGTAPVSTTDTEVTDPSKDPFIKVWDKPSTGNTFVFRSVLRQVTSTSTAGTTTIEVTRTVRATSTDLLFVDRTTGHVYGYNLETGTRYQISNTTIPGVHDAYIFNNRIIMRHLDTDRKTILSIIATLPAVQEGMDALPLIGINNLPNNVSSVAINQSKTEASYIVPNDSGASIYTVTPKGINRIASSPFSEWMLSYGGDQLYATSKASAYLEGVTVSLPSFSTMIGGKTGLTSIGGSNGYLLNSMWSSSGLATFATKGSELLSFSTRTLAAKCTPFVVEFLCGVPRSLPSSNEGLPDDWYQGRVSFSDELMTLNPATGESSSYYTFPENFGSIDVTSLSVSTRGEYVSLIRKQDGALFLLNTTLFVD